MLVSLAVIGLIAGLTVPSVVASVESSRNKALFREIFQTISSITSEGVMNGDFNNITSWDIVNQNGAGSITNYISSKLNYSKQCLTADITSDGCKRGYPGTSANNQVNRHNARWILPSGAKVQAYDGGFFNTTYMFWMVTTKAYADDMTFGKDTIGFQCNVTDATITSNGVIIKPGACAGWDPGFWTTLLQTALGNV